MAKRSGKSDEDLKKAHQKALREDAERYLGLAKKLNEEHNLGYDLPDEPNIPPVKD